MATRSELILEITSRLDQAVAELGKVKSAIAEVDGQAEKTSQRLQQTKEDFEELGPAATKVGGAVIAAFGGATAAFASFETASANVQNITDLSNASMAAFDEQLRALPSSLGEADDLMRGLYQTISAGITDPAAAMEVLTASAMAAKGNLADLGQTVDATTSVLNAYRLGADEVTDVLDAMTKTVDLGKLEFSELADNVGKGISIAQSAGVSYQELLTVLAQLTLSGLSVEESMTAIRGILSTVLSPSKEVTDAMHSLGVDMSTAAIEAQGFGGFMATVATAVEGNAEATAALFPNIRALNGALQLASAEGGARYAEMLEQITNSSGKVESNFARMSATTTATTATMVADLKRLGIAVGEELAGQVTALESAASGVIGVLTDLDAHALRQVIVVGEAALAWAALVKVVPGVIAGVQAIEAAMAGGTVAAMGFASAVNLAAAAGVAIALAIGEVADRIDDNANRLEAASIRENEKRQALAAAVKAQGLNIAELARQYTLEEAQARSWIVTAEGEKVAVENVADAYQMDISAMAAYLEEKEKAGTATEQQRAILAAYRAELARVAAEQAKANDPAEKAKKLTEEATAAVKASTEAAEKARQELIAKYRAEEEAAEAAEKAAAAEEKKAEALRKSSAALSVTIRETANLIAMHGMVADLAGAFGLVADSVDGSVVYLRDFSAEFAALQGTPTTRLKAWFDDAAGGAAALEQAAADAWEVMANPPPPPPGYWADWQENIRDVSDSFEAQLGLAITRGIESAGEGELTEYLGDLFADWSGMLYDAMGSALSEAFSTGSFSEGLSNYVQAIEQNPLMFGLGGAAMVYQATQVQDRTVGTIQGAIGGAQSGFAMSQNWIGAVIGAVIGGAAGYFGAGSDNPRTSFSLSPGQHASVHTIGQDRSDQVNQQLADQIQSAYSEFRLSYLRLAQMFEDPELLDALGTMPALYTGYIEGTADELMEWLIGDWMPDAFETAFRPIFEQGLAGLGVNEATMGALFGELAGLEGEARVEGLETYIRAVVNSAQLLEDMDWSAMTEEAMRSPRAAFVAAMTEGLEDIDVMMSGWDNLTLLEQADQALDVQEAIVAAREMELQYIAQLMQLQEDLLRSIAGQRESLVFGGMDPTEQRAYLEEQLAAIFAELGTEGLDPNRVAQLTADAQRYIDMLRQLFGDALDEPLRQPATLPPGAGGGRERESPYPEGFLEGLDAAAEAGRELEDAFDWVDMVEELGMTARQVFEEDMAASLDEIAVAWEAIDWTDPNALAQAQEVQDLVAAAREQELAYLRQIMAIQDQITDSIARQREGFQLEGMDTGQQVQYYGSRIMEIFDLLRGGNLSPEEVQELTAEAQRYIGLLGNLFGPDAVEHLIPYLDTLETLSTGALDEAREEAHRINQEHLDWLRAVNTELEAFANRLRPRASARPAGDREDNSDARLDTPGSRGDTDEEEQTARDYLVELLDTLAALAPAAIQDSIDEAEAINQQYLDRLEEVNAALVRFRHNLDGGGHYGNRRDPPGAVTDDDLVKPYRPTDDDWVEEHGGGKPHATPQDPGGRDEFGDDDFPSDDDSIPPYIGKSIGDAGDRAAASISTAITDALTTLAGFTETANAKRAADFDGRVADTIVDAGDRMAEAVNNAGDQLAATIVTSVADAVAAALTSHAVVSTWNEGQSGKVPTKPGDDTAGGAKRANDEPPSTPAELLAPVADPLNAITELLQQFSMDALIRGIAAAVANQQPPQGFISETADRMAATISTAITEALGTLAGFAEESNAKRAADFDGRVADTIVDAGDRMVGALGDAGDRLGLIIVEQLTQSVAAALTGDQVTSAVGEGQGGKLPTKPGDDDTAGGAKRANDEPPSTPAELLAPVADPLNAITELLQQFSMDALIRGIAAAVANQQPPQVTVTGSAAPMIQLIQSVVAASRPTAGGRLA